MSDRVRLAREIAARTKPRFIEIKRERHTGVPFSEEQLAVMRSGLTAEEYRWKLIRQYLKKERAPTEARRPIDHHLIFPSHQTHAVQFSMPCQ